MADTSAAQLIFDLTQTDLPLDTPVYVYTIGLVLDSSGNQHFYYLDSNFMPQSMQGTDNTQNQFTFPNSDSLPPSAVTALNQNYPLAWADYSTQVTVGSNLVVCLGNINTTNIPDLGTGTSAFSGRIYFSVGVPKLPFSVTTDDSGNVTGYTAPVFGNGTGIGGSMTLFDWIEFSYDSQGNFDGNTTQVNQFGFPLYLSAVDTSGNPTALQGVLNHSRTDIFSAVSNFPAPFTAANSLVAIDSTTALAYPPHTNYLRALAPDEISQANSSLSTYFDNVVSTAYRAWQSTPLVVTDASSGSFTGVVLPLAQFPQFGPPPHYPGYPALCFYEGAYATQQELVEANPSFAFFLTCGEELSVTSNDIWQCANTLASGGTAQKNVGKIIAAAFNRGTVIVNGTVATSMTDVNCSGESGSFYPAGSTCNIWSQLFHQVNSNGLAYGFAYDDVCNQSTSIPAAGDSLVAASVRIALGTFYS